MLVYLLALAVALGSLAIYLAAFFFPEIHRKNDFIWSGVGMFYALVLWVCAGRISGGVMLGQIASVALLGWLGWQSLTLRYQLTPPAQRTPVSQEVLKEKLANLSIPEKLGGLFSTVKDKAQQTLTSVKKDKTKPDAAPSQKPAPSQALKDAITSSGGQVVPSTPAVSVQVETQTPPTRAIASLETQTPPTDNVEASPTPAIASVETQTPPTETDTPGLVPPNPPPPELVEAAIEDAEAKGVESSPPPVEEPPEFSEVPPTAEANQPLDNPPNPT